MRNRFLIPDSGGLHLQIYHAIPGTGFGREACRLRAWRPVSGALPDRAFGVEFGGQRRATDDMRVDAAAAQAVLEVAHRVLARADHDVVDRQQTRDLRGWRRS